MIHGDIMDISRIYFQIMMNGIFCSWIFVPIYGNFSTNDDDDDDDEDEYESLDL